MARKPAAKKGLDPALERDLAVIRDHRRDRLHPIEEARLYARLAKSMDSSSQRQLAEYVGVSQARISQRLALLEMPGEIADLMTRPDAPLTERHARALRRLPDPKMQVWLAKRIFKERTTVDTTNEIVSGMLDDLGVEAKRPSPWSRAPGLRWREELDTLELHVQAPTPEERLKLLRAFLDSQKKKR